MPKRGTIYKRQTIILCWLGLLLLIWGMNFSFMSSSRSVSFAQESGRDPFDGPPRYNSSSTPNTTSRPPTRSTPSGDFRSRYQGTGTADPPSAPSRPGTEPKRLDVDPKYPAARMPERPASQPIQSRQTPVTPTSSERTQPSLPATNDIGNGLPGEQRLEGPQTPSVTVEKRAPKEMQVGRAAVIELVVRNMGTSAVHQVLLHDEIPRGSQLRRTKPQAHRDPQGRLLWKLGTMHPNDEAIIEVEVVPLEEGELGSVATVSYATEVTSRSLVTQPRLEVHVVAQKQVMIQEEVELIITLSNPGTGVAENVVIQEQIPEGLSHPAGESLEYQVGDLAPQETREIRLQLTAIKPGMITNTLVALGEGPLQSQPVDTQIEVISPLLKLRTDGPKRRFLDREASYVFEVSNPGTANAEQVQLVATLPTGLKFLEADQAGRYDAQTRQVYWLIDSLPPQEKGVVQLMALAVEEGSQRMKVEASSRRGLSALEEPVTDVEGIAAVVYQVMDVEDPIETGEETVYEIRVENQGSKAARNVQISVLLPEAMSYVSAEGQHRHRVQGNQVIFEPFPQLNPKAETTYQVRAKGIAPGDLRCRVQLVSDEMSAPVFKEESTRVYADE
ncbi:60 kDa outer membrane protein [Planctomycetales bacterium 10988]|nr:60 kDa outer membrane protein [Planctomycetales bacterium 10988]